MLPGANPGRGRRLGGQNSTSQNTVEELTRNLMDYGGVRLPWLGMTLFLAGISLLLLRHVEVTDSSPVPSVGGEVYYPGELKPPKTPDFFIMVDRDSVRMVAMFKAVPRTQMKVVMTDVDAPTCGASNADINVWPNKYWSVLERRGTTPFGTTEYHPMLIDVHPTAIDVVVACRTLTKPLHDSYATRALDFYPPAGGKLILGNAAAREVYRRTLPEHVAFSVSGNLDTRVSGPQGRGVLPSMWDERVVGTDSFVIRARWEDVTARVRREYFTFFAAALLGLAFGAMLEALRPLLDHRLASRS